MFCEETSAHDRKLVEKVWGSEDWIVNNNDYCGKILNLAPDGVSSLHKHRVKKETFLVIAGTVLLEIMIVENTPEFHVLRSWALDAITIKPGVPHRFRALDGPATVIEFSTHHEDADVVRLEPSFRLPDEPFESTT